MTTVRGQTVLNVMGGRMGSVQRWIRLGQEGGGASPQLSRSGQFCLALSVYLQSNSIHQCLLSNLSKIGGPSHGAGKGYSKSKGPELGPRKSVSGKSQRSLGGGAG